MKKYHPKPVLYKKKKPAEQDYGHERFEQNLLFSMLVSKALSTINQHVYKLNKNLTNEELTQILVSYYPEALHELGLNSTMVTGYEAHMDGEKTATLTNWDFAARQCENAARSAREFWNPDVYPEIQRRAREQGAKGGRAYCTYSLEDHLLTAHLSAKEAAALLGINIRNVYRMRKRYAALDATTGEVDAEELFAESAESDQDGTEVGERSASTRKRLDENDTRRSQRSASDARRTSRLDEAASGFLRDFEELKIPY